MKYLPKKPITLVIALLAVLAVSFTAARETYVANSGEGDGRRGLVVNIFNREDYASGQVATSTKKAEAAAPSSRLSIPAIKVNAKIENVGTTATGQMDVPARLANVGWYKHGTKPGEVGSAVIAGHLDDSFRLPAVFYKLNKLEQGDDIYITDASGKKLHFVVISNAEYDVSTAPVDEIFNDKSGRYLKLITCAGSWDKDEYAYNRRVVVTAELKT